MNKRIILSGMLLAAALSLQAAAGTLFYVPVPAKGSDAQSGLDASKAYTNAVAAGTNKERAVNGVALAPLSATENVSTANGVTLSAATGTLANGGGRAESIQADGGTASILSGMIFNDGASDNSEQYAVLDPATLTAGKTYDLRVYICNATGENRQVSLSFAGDGKPAVSTDFFNEDDATTSAGGFADPNQVYYINYRFTWDGVSTPGFTATQRFGSTPFCLFALTNQEVGGEVDAQPAGAVVQAEPEPIAAAPTPRNLTATAMDYEDDIGVSSDVFYSSDTLRKHGRWVSVGSYGRCWQPENVGDDWEPYTRGRWVYSADDGWVWDSDEDFGWATYHYGRWFREEDTGWYWMPGKVWGPAWVSWRHGHSYVGWAPLPPVALAVAGIGIASWADHRWGMGPRAYNFVNARDLGAPSMARVLIPRQQNAAIMANTNNVTNIARTRNGIFNGGPNFSAVNNAIIRSGNSAIPTVSVNRHAGTRPVTADGKFSSLSAGVLAVTAPSVVRTKKPTSLPPVAATIAKPKFDKGWNGIADPKNAAALQAKIAGETPGTKAKTAPARLPGAIPSAAAAAATGTGAANVLKPFRNGKPGGTAFVKPGQPAQPAQTPVTPTLRRPGTPVNPTAVTPVIPGQPTTAPLTTTPDGKRKRGENPTAGTVPLVKPGQPVTPAVVAPAPGQPAPTAQVPAVKPGKLVKPGTVITPPATVPPAVQPIVPATPKPETVRSKNRTPQPGSPGTPGTDRNKNRTTPTTPVVPPTVVKPTVPTTPATNPATVVTPTVPSAPSNDSPRHKKGTPSSAPVKPAPDVKPTAPVPAAPVKPAAPPEADRIKRHSAPPAAPTAPVPPPPQPTPVKKVAPPPAAPATVAKPHAAPQPAAPPRPVPAAVAPVRPAPPVNVPPRPAAPAPAPAAPGKGAKPTPTPTPGARR